MFRKITINKKNPNYFLLWLFLNKTTKKMVKNYIFLKNCELK